MTQNPLFYTIESMTVQDVLLGMNFKVVVWNVWYARRYVHFLFLVPKQPKYRYVLNFTFLSFSRYFNSQGRYQDENDSSDIVCKFCETGKYNSDDRKDLTKHDSIEDCTLCADGFFSNPGDSSCDVCPSGYITYTELLKNTSRLSQNTELTYCLACLPGTISTSPGLNNCTGKYIQEQEY